MSARRPAALLLGMALWAAGAARAQSVDSSKPYAIPQSPAFTFLGTTPGQVDRPTTARALALSLVQDVRTAGGLPRGLALDVTPWSFVPGLRIPLPKYQTDPVAYALANTQVSLGSRQGKSDTASTDVAVGLRVTVFDRSDPMTDTAYTNGLRRALLTCLPSQPSTTSAGDDSVKACARDVTGRARKRWLDRHWNAASLAVATAGGWHFPASQQARENWLGWAGWATGAAPLFQGGQIVGQVRYDSRTANGTGLSYGGRAYFGTASTNAFAEVSRSAADSLKTSWAGGVELRVMQSFWLSAGLGTVSPLGQGAHRVALIANLSWDVSETPRFGRFLR